MATQRRIIKELRSLQSDTFPWLSAGPEDGEDVHKWSIMIMPMCSWCRGKPLPDVLLSSTESRRVETMNRLSQYELRTKPCYCSLLPYWSADDPKPIFLRAEFPSNYPFAKIKLSFGDGDHQFVLKSPFVSRQNGSFCDCHMMEWGPTTTLLKMLDSSIYDQFLEPLDYYRRDSDNLAVFRELTSDQATEQLKVCGPGPWLFATAFRTGKERCVLPRYALRLILQLCWQIPTSRHAELSMYLSPRGQEVFRFQASERRKKERRKNAKSSASSKNSFGEDDGGGVLETLLVKMLTGRQVELTHRINFARHMVHDLQDMLAQELNIPPKQQRLVWNGNHLTEETTEEEGRTLSEWGLQDGDTVHLVLRLRCQNSDGTTSPMSVTNQELHDLLVNDWSGFVRVTRQERCEEEIRQDRCEEEQEEEQKEEQKEEQAGEERKQNGGEQEGQEGGHVCPDR